MKKHLFLMLVLALALTLMLSSCEHLLEPVWPSFDAPGFKDDNGEEEVFPSAGLAYELNTNATTGEQYYVVTGRGTCTDEHIIIPSTYKGVAVTQIKDQAFLNDTNLKAINLPEGLQKIGYIAFAGTSLKELIIPDSVTEISSMIFAFSPVEKLVIGSGLKCYGDGNNPFACSTALKEIVVSKDNPYYYVENGVLYAELERTGKILIQYPTASEKKSFVVPDDVNIIAYFAFSCADSLEEITVPSNTITMMCFYWCDSLAKVNFDVVLDDVFYSYFFVYTFTDYFSKNEPLEPAIGGISNLKMSNYTLYYNGGEITKEGIDAIIEELMNQE